MMTIESKKKNRKRKMNRRKRLMDDPSSSSTSSAVKREKKKTSPSAVKKKKTSAAVKKKKTSSAVKREKTSPSSTSIFISATLEDRQNWYLLNLNPSTTKTSPKLLSPVSSFPFPPKRSYHIATVALGSKLYAFGGLTEEGFSLGLSVGGPARGISKEGGCLGLRRAISYDTTQNNTTTKEWKDLPPMFAPRIKPKVLACGGRIYVFGCSKTPFHLLKPFGEAYNPVDNIWSSMPELPQCYYRDMHDFAANVVSCAVFPDQNQIILYMELSVCLCFNVEQWEWGYFDIHPRPKGDYPNLVTVGNLLYMFFGLAEFYVYDSDNPGDGLQRLSGGLPNFCGPFPILSGSTIPSLYLGDGNFCIFWVHPHHCCQGIIRCVKFRINQSIGFEDKCFRHVSFLGCQEFKLDGWINAYDAFLR